MSLFSKNSVSIVNSSFKPKNITEASQRGEFLVTQESRQSVNFAEKAFHGSTVISKQQVRLQKILARHDKNRTNWLETIGTFKSLRKDKSSARFARDPSRTRLSEISPLNVTLVERSVDFKYDKNGILR